MDKLKLFEYYNKMCNQNIVLDFQGVISQDLLVGMAEMIKNKFTQKFGKTTMVKKMFSVFIELAQNIAYYSFERVELEKGKEKVGAGIIVVTEQDTYYTITSGNKIEKDKAMAVVKQCEHLNRLNEDELKVYYKGKLREPRPEGKKGGGVGLVEILRKAKSKIEYKVTPINDIESFLVLSVKIEEIL